MQYSQCTVSGFRGETTGEMGDRHDNSGSRGQMDVGEDTVSGSRGGMVDGQDNSGSRGQIGVGEVTSVDSRETNDNNIQIRDDLIVSSKSLNIMSNDQKSFDKVCNCHILGFQENPNCKIFNFRQGSTKRLSNNV